MSIRFLQGDCRDVLKTLDAQSVHCCVTSPPYFGLRDYGTGNWSGGDPDCSHRKGPLVSALSTLRADGRAHQGPYSGEKATIEGIPFSGTCGKCGAVRTDAQIGMETSPAEYVATMVSVFREVWRVLRDDGTLWLNLGDSFNAAGRKGHGTSIGYKQGTNRASADGSDYTRASCYVLKEKDLLMIPARVAIALQADGWYLRQDVIWHKPNPMPESVTDRPTSSHEHVFLLTKKPTYFYDAEAVREADSGQDHRRDIVEAIDTSDGHLGVHKGIRTAECRNGGGRNLRNVWTIATQPYAEAHFATFPPLLAERCIKAGTSERGYCPQCGAPWVRTITKGEPDEAHRAACGADTSGGYNGQSTKGHDAAGVQNASDVKRRILDGLRKKSYAWSPSCACGVAHAAPCVVLDPFSGAGTTALCADRLGRNAIGIDLNTAYGDLARDRLIADAGMFAEIMS